MLTRTKAIILPTATSVTNPLDFAVTAESKNSTTIKLPQSANVVSLALHQSILNGRFKQVKYLLKLGSKVNIKDMYGRTCLMLACLSDQEEYGLRIAKLLMRYGADMNLQDFMGRSAICIACSQKREKIVDLFVENNTNLVDFRQKDNDGDILLNHAAMYGTPKMVKSILDKMKNLYIPIDQRNNLGYTALLLAIKNKNWLNAYILLNDGDASVFLKDDEYFYNAIEWILILNQDITNNRSLISITLDQQHLKTSSQLHKASSMNEVTNNSQLSSINDFQRDFQSTKSHTNLSLNSQISTVSSNKQSITYKTWYGLPNPYYDSEELGSPRCEHIQIKNYTIDHFNSSYIPPIFTPRIAPRMQTTTLASQRKALQHQQQEQETKYIYNDNDEEENIYKLMDKIYEKMSTNESISSIAEKLNERLLNSTNQMSPQNQNQSFSRQISDRSPVFLTSAKSVPSTSSTSMNSQQKPTFRDKRVLQQFILKQQEGIFLPNISNTAKILALQPSSNTIVKNEIHTIYEYYQDPTLNLPVTNRNNLTSALSNDFNINTNRSSKFEQNSRNALGKKKNSVKFALNDSCSSNKQKEVAFNFKK